LTAVSLGGAAGCGPEEYVFSGRGEFLISSADVAGSSESEPVAFTSRVTLRHGKHRTSELVLGPNCILRARNGAIIGTRVCVLSTTAGTLSVNLVDGAWTVSDSPSQSEGSCQLWRHDLRIEAKGTVTRGSAKAARFVFAGSRESEACTEISGDSGGTWIWDEGEGQDEGEVGDWQGSGGEYSDDDWDADDDSDGWDDDDDSGDDDWDEGDDDWDEGDDDWDGGD